MCNSATKVKYAESSLGNVIIIQLSVLTNTSSGVEPLRQHKIVPTMTGYQLLQYLNIKLSIQYNVLWSQYAYISLLVMIFE